MSYSTENKKTRFKLKYIFTICFVFLLIFILCYNCGLDDQYVDIKQYVNMTLGQHDEVTDPFASRIAAPLIANYLVDTFGLSAKNALLAIGLFFYASTGFAFALYARHAAIPLEWAAVFAGLPYAAVLCKYGYTPDSPAVFFTFLALIAIKTNTQKYMTPIFCLIGIFFRKTLIIPYLFFALHCAYKKQFTKSSLIMVASIVGIAIISMIVPGDAENVHSMNTASYMILKLPANFISNVLGTSIYTNAFSWCSEPYVIFNINFIPYIGNINKVGFCSPDITVIFHTILLYITIFGLFSFIIITLVVRRNSNKADQILSLAFIILFILAPALGKTVPRLFLYAYPFMLVMAPTVISTLKAKRWGRPFLFLTFVVQCGGIALILL